MKKQELQKIIREEIQSVLKEQSPTQFNVENMDLAELDEYGLVLKDILDLIKKHSTHISNLDKSPLKQMIVAQMKAAAAESKKQKDQIATNKSFAGIKPDDNSILGYVGNKPIYRDK